MKLYSSYAMLPRQQIQIMLLLSTLEQPISQTPVFDLRTEIVTEKIKYHDKYKNINLL